MRGRAYLGIALCTAGPLAVGGLTWSAQTTADGLILAGLSLVIVADQWLAAPWNMIGRAWRPLWAIVGVSLPVAGLAHAGFHAGGAATSSILPAAAALAGLDRIRRVVSFRRRPATPAAELSFPLRDGRYAVVQGGPSVVNGHAGTRPQRWALDLVKLRPSGRRAQGLFPRTLESYAIFGERVASPCDGTVVTAADGRPDLVPPESQPQVPAGNHIVIRMADGLLVVLAHLKKSSVGVRPGGRVRAGQIVGRVGNSGNTTEPHLHIHVGRGNATATGDGEGVPMVFGETRAGQLRRNDVVRV